MFREPFLYRIDAWVIAVVLCLGMMGSAWAGYCAGRNRAERASARTQRTSDLGSVEGACAGLLALVLAFNFSMAAGRFDARQQLVVRASNAIGTVYLRCALLEPDDRSFCEDRTRTYVDLRIAYDNAGRDTAQVERLLAQSDALQGALWARLSTIACERPTPVNAIVMAALNDMFDVGSERVASMRIVVPQEVTIAVLLLCFAWASIAGYGYGLKKNESVWAWLVFSVLVALVVFVTLDFDRPRRGFIRLDAGNASMLEVRASMQAGAKP